MVERDLDADGQQHDFPTNESLGMDGVDIQLEDYSQPAAASNDASKQNRPEQDEEAKEPQQATATVNSEK